jgi:long-chain acyl-CoA synthetase
LFYFTQIDTLAKLFYFVLKKYHDRQCLGTRQVFKEQEEKQPDGRVFQKLDLGDYHWMRYSDVNAYADEFGRGIREVGVQPRSHVCIFADTRAEWLIAAIGCFKNAIALCTIYTNLGPEGIMHGIKQTNVNTVITTVELLPKLRPLLKELSHVKTIIYMESATRPEPEGLHGVQLLPFQTVLSKGRVRVSLNANICLKIPHQVADVFFYVYCRPPNSLQTTQSPKTRPSSCTQADPPVCPRE